MSQNKIRICVESFDHRLLDQNIAKIIETFNNLESHQVVIKGPVPLPTRRKRFTIIRATHKYDSREQFEMRKHRRVLDVYNVEPKDINKLNNLRLSAGIHINVNVN